ncbi:MAG: HK97 family phage prohead protease [Treponema sp.]|jgi:HK97 family phage prohead protease|nr:HK97 family phage prohead protease [Treponema sp.]
MLLRMKGGDFVSCDFRGDGVLLDYLGVKNEAAGPQKVAGNVELIASIPFHLAADKENNGNEVAWTFSTFDLDRFDERIDPEGWDFRQYLKNPVVEWAHRYDIPAIGKADGLYADKAGLHGTILFNDKSFDAFGWAIGERVKHGVIRAGSVGFRILEIELPTKEESKDGTTLIFRKQELLEFSVCNVPANPAALAKGKAGQQDMAPNFWGNFIQNTEGV